MGNNKYYWSPVFHWEQLPDGSIKIGKYKFSKEINIFFPMLYFDFQKGFEIDDYLKRSKPSEQRRLAKLLSILTTKRILVSNLMDYHDIFDSLYGVFTKMYPEELCNLDTPIKIKEFKEKVQSRGMGYFKGQLEFKLPSPQFKNNKFNIYQLLKNRRSTRVFSTTLISEIEFTHIFSIFQQNVIDESNGIVTYNYPSDGGLYPVDIYIYVKENRIENIPEGLYFYNPINNSFLLISDKKITEGFQYDTNRSIFNHSAFTVFLTYNLRNNFPKYGGAGLEYALIDAGIITMILNLTCEEYGIGTCSIGKINFESIKQNFMLKDDFYLLHTIECGKKVKE